MNIYCIFMHHQYVTEYLFKCLIAEKLYENNYFLATSLARPLAAKKLVEIAHQ